MELKDLKLVDLSQPWSVLTPPWPTYPAPSVRFIKRLSEHKVNGQEIKTSLHVGTHLDAPLHFISSGEDVASISLERLFGEAAIVDISDSVGEYEIYEPKHIIEKVEVKEGDILIIHTGFHHYAWYEKGADEVAYFCKHPGPHIEFAKWALKMKLKWIGVDCGSADHPMNTIIRKIRPDLAKECEEKLGNPLEEIFPTKYYQLMHTMLFPHGIIHAENLGGDIDKVLNRRAVVGCFPWKFQGGEAAFCRIVAFVEE
ncbi:MAG TPA: cyclase family protein [Candidatus Korarchaeota archaeon]|nr:cyclase family protein [Candidatus Korarchaeota archaeon]